MEPIRSLLLHRLRPSPDNSWVGSCIISFVACSAFTRVTTCRLAKSPYATLSTGGSGGFVASTAAPIATGWSDPVPGRVYLPLWSSAFHGALLSPDLYKGMSRTFFPLRRRRGFGSRHPAPLTIEDARLVSCPWVIPSQQLHLLFSSDDADQFRNESSRAVVRCQPWIYLRLVA
jgi:hypothetical protein